MGISFDGNEIAVVTGQEQNDLSKIIDENIAEFLRGIVSIFGWRGDRRDSEEDLVPMEDKINVLIEWDPFSMVSPRRGTKEIVSVIRRKDEPPATITYILFYQGVEAGQWVLPYRTTNDDLLTVICSSIKRARLSFSPEPGYVHIPEDERELDRLFKKLSTQLFDYLSEAVRHWR